MNTRESVSQAVDLLGGTTKTAAQLGVSPPFVCAMRAGTRPVPAVRALQLERLTGGAVRADDMCPKLSAGAA